MRSYLWRLYCPVLSAALKEEIDTERIHSENVENVLDRVARLRPVPGLIPSSTTSTAYDEARTMLAAAVRVAS